MPLIFPDSVPFDPVAHRAFLEKIQGNILKGHGRDNVRLLFFEAPGSRTATRDLFQAALAAHLITPAWEQREQAQLQKDTKAAAPPQFSLMLTKEFFWRQRPRKWFARVPDDYFPPEMGGAFLAGAYSRMGNDTRRWQPVYRKNPHGVWLLAHDDRTVLDTQEARLRRLLADHGGKAERPVENGRRWHDAGDRDAVREPFGFRDGISTAAFLLPDPPAPKHVQIGLDRVLIPQGPHAGGSFFVLQKLEQNVAKFRRFEQAMRRAFAAGNQPLDVRDPGALLIGRERDGTPLAGTAPGPANDFDFDRPADAGGGRCPFHAHIRKANARTDSLPGSGLLDRQFVRRGAVYDDRGQLPPAASPDYEAGEKITRDVGLLFMGYMRDVQGQFEHMRRSWFESMDFPDPADAMPDVLINGELAPNREWTWRQRGITVPRLPDFVGSRGAAFCYVPSLEWLENYGRDSQSW